MLETANDKPRTDEEWRQFVGQRSFGQVIGWDAQDQPVVTPLHYIFNGLSTIEFHLHRRNPVWEPLRRTGKAILAVTGGDAYIPTHWNALQDDDPRWSAPTSYYAAVQISGNIEILHAKQDLADLLNRQMKRFQPEGGYHPVEPGNSPFGRMLSGILGARLLVEDVRIKFKFGGNRPAPHLRRIADLLGERKEGEDLRARDLLLRRLRDPGE